MVRDAAASVRRALARADDGRSLSRDDVAALLTARDDELAHLCEVARRVRTLGWGSTVTYSRKVFIPLTMLCRDRCHYCTFARPPARIEQAFLSIDEVVAIAESGRITGCKEALFTLGDRPEERYPEARAWLDARGYASTLDYVRAAAIAVIERTGLLPHLNPGVMSWEEMARLRPVAASMGLMLESTSDRLGERGRAHHGSPDKVPAVRLRTIEDAGRLAIPFTSGILIGIGEHVEERADALLALRASHRRLGHLQEVIVQNFRAKAGTAMRDAPEPDEGSFLAAVATARVVFGTAVSVQAPPNLSDEAMRARLLDAGIDDWGGVSPITPDHVNPERPWPAIEALARTTADARLVLRERLAIRPSYVQRPERWIAARMRAPIAALATEDGHGREGHVPRPVPWQDPELEFRPRAIALTATRTSMRADADEVYGEVPGEEDPITAAWRTRDRQPARVAIEVRGALRLAAAHRPISDAQALALFESEGADLAALLRVADDLRREAVGDDVTYVVNRNINFTNVCYVGCRFCAFAQRAADPEAYTLTLSEVADRAAEAWDRGATEICMQGGIHPDLPETFLFDLLDAVRGRVPAMHIHAFSPMEVMTGAARLGISHREFLEECRRRGLGSIPGTAAEILDDDLRWVLTKGKLPADTWEAIVRTAHAVGLPSTATIMFGHVDAPPHWVAHLRRVAGIGAETGGFTEFVPLPFVHRNAPLYLAGRARPGPSTEDSLRMHAVARILLDGVVHNVQVSWVKLGPEVSAAILEGGANDLGGTLMEETISRMAGSEWGIAMDVADLEAIARSVGRTARERTTTYGTPADLRRSDVFHNPGDARDARVAGV